MRKEQLMERLRVGYHIESLSYFASAPPLTKDDAPTVDDCMLCLDFLFWSLERILTEPMRLPEAPEPDERNREKMLRRYGYRSADARRIHWIRMHFEAATYVVRQVQLSLSTPKDPEIHTEVGAWDDGHPLLNHLIPIVSNPLIVDQEKLIVLFHVGQYLRDTVGAILSEHFILAAPDELELYEANYSILSRAASSLASALVNTPGLIDQLSPDYGEALAVFLHRTEQEQEKAILERVDLQGRPAVYWDPSLAMMTTFLEGVVWFLNQKSEVVSGLEENLDRAQRLLGNPRTLNVSLLDEKNLSSFFLASHTRNHQWPRNIREMEAVLRLLAHFEPRILLQGVKANQLMPMMFPSGVIVLRIPSVDCALRPVVSYVGVRGSPEGQRQKVVRARDLRDQFQRNPLLTWMLSPSDVQANVRQGVFVDTRFTLGMTSLLNYADSKINPGAKVGRGLEVAGESAPSALAAGITASFTSDADPAVQAGMVAFTSAFMRLFWGRKKQ